MGYFRLSLRERETLLIEKWVGGLWRATNPLGGFPARALIRRKRERGIGGRGERQMQKQLQILRLVGRALRGPLRSG